MQLTSILFYAIYATGVLSAPATDDTDYAPDFANSSVPPGFSDKANPLVARGCYSGAPYGCDPGKGRCWKICGDGGQWCWTAEGDGGGDWNTCTVWSQCSTDQACGKNCYHAEECGCSC